MFVLITTVTAVYSFQSSPKLFKTTTGRRRQFINVYPSIPTASNHYQLTPAAKAKPRIKHAISSTKFFVHPFNDIKNPSTSTLSTAFIGHALPVAKVSRCYQQLLGRTMSWLPSTKKWAINIQNARRTVASIVLAFVLVFGATWTPAWAVSGGRVGGGSFKSSPSRSSSSRSGSYGGTSTLSRPSYGGRAPMILRSPVYNYGVQQRTPPIIINHFGNRWYAPTHESALIHTRASAKDIIVLTGAGALLAYSMRNNYNRRTNQGDSSNNGPLGFGYTVGSLTVAMDVPDRSDPTNILTKLSRVATATDTNSRKGVQDLLSDVALELLRQEKAVTSAAAQFKSYPISGQAEREFQIQSVQSQSKVDRLTGTLRFQLSRISLGCLLEPLFFY